MKLKVTFPDELLNLVSKDKQEALIGVLSEDPRPTYQNDRTRRYGLSFDKYDVRFYVDDDTLTVVEVVEL
jgi:hypothetical protein